MEIFTSTETIGRRKLRCIHNVYIMYKVASGILVQLYNSCTVRNEYKYKKRMGKEERGRGWKGEERGNVGRKKEGERKGKKGARKGEGRGNEGGRKGQGREKEGGRKGQGKKKEGGRKGFHGIYQGVGVDYI